MSFHKRSSLYAAYIARIRPSNVVSLEQYRMSKLTPPIHGEPNKPFYDANKRLVSIVEHADQFAQAMNLVHDLSQASVGDDLWPFVEKAKGIVK